MLVRKKADCYPISVILCVLAIDLTIWKTSTSLWLPIAWMIASLNIKGWICSWNHNHQHYKFFKVAWANRLIELAMGLHTGIVGEAWVLHHTLGHHLNYLDQSKDESAWKTPSGRVMSRLEYTATVAGMAYPLALKVGQRYPKSRIKLIQNMVLTVGIVGLLAWFNWFNTLILFVIPMVGMLTMTAYDTYDHHAGLDVTDPYEATYNITNRWYNFFTCNLGYHTAHHLQCGRHWSELPQLHESIKDRIPAELYREPGFPFNVMTQLEQGLSQWAGRIPETSTR